MAVSGAVSAAGSVRVWLIPQDEAKWRAPLTWFDSPLNEGAFTIYAAPGDYLVIIDERADRAFSAYDLDKAEDYIRERAGSQAFITLKAGERRSVRF
jgi:hypothetical protein